VEYGRVEKMKIDVNTRCIITKEGGEQVIVEDISSIMLEVEFMGQKYNIFKTINELILNKRWS
jgi:hypothetical protein